MTPAADIIVGDVIVGELVTGVVPLTASAFFARPKSSTLTWPSLVSAMFAGFKSRSMIPLS
jgi:hypothetical protein